MHTSSNQPTLGNHQNKGFTRPSSFRMKYYKYKKFVHKANQCKSTNVHSSAFQKDISFPHHHAPANASIVIPSLGHDCSIDMEAHLHCDCCVPVLGRACVEYHQRISQLPWVFIGDEKVRVPHDTGCNGIVVNKNKVKQELTFEQVFNLGYYKCIIITDEFKFLMMLDHSILKVPTTRYHVCTSWFSGEVRAMCLENPVYDLIIGNITGVRRL